ncbi:MAG: DUF1232 domain-containing protein [Alphaproteobacteria bacterium]|nr:DUF1232 domain-containing protein [Alphaproteobacteria bacterium]
MSERATDQRDTAPSDASERNLRDRLWRKLRATLGKVPFADEVLAAYYCAVDPTTPARVKVAIFGALAYFITPIDAIPDFLVGLGFTDDATVLMATIAVVRGAIRSAHRDRARQALEALAADDRR